MALVMCFLSQQGPNLGWFASERPRVHSVFSVEVRILNVIPVLQSSK